jgi:hypothetical protein
MFFRGIVLIASVLAVTACTSTGSSEKQIGDNLWEIRAWDGHTCKGSTARADCDAALMPVIKEKATFLCGNKSAEVDKCQRRDGASGDRIYCLARCDDKA